MSQFSGKTDNFDFFDLNLPRNEFWDQNLEIVSLDSELAPPIYRKCQISDKTDNFEFFDLNLGPNHVPYFGSYNVAGVAENWVEAEKNWVEVEMSWVEMDGAGWRWMHGLVIPV